MTNLTPSITQSLDAAINWWRDAGVDVDFAEDATNWLAQPAPDKGNKATSNEPKTKTKTRTPMVEELEKKPVQQRILSDDAIPGNLDAFHKWWLEDPGLDSMGPRGRVAPRGPATGQGAKLMVLVLDPEPDDTATLLSGARGRLLSKILAASGVDESEVYFASVLPRHMPVADGADLANKGYAEILHLHIALAKPEYICALGSHILPLLAHGAADTATKEAGSLQEINHDNRTTPLFVAESLEGMMGSPSLKARFWRRWVQWTERLG